MTVLVTGCGGAVGQGIVEALSSVSNEILLLGSETDSYAAPFYLEKKALSKVYHTSHVDSPDYIPELINLCRNENVDVIFPGTDVELPKLAAGKESFADYGVKVIISPYETIEICRDKLLSFRHFANKVSIVRSASDDADLETALNFTGLPAVLKPRIGWGSKIVYKIESVAQAEILVKQIGKPVFQTWLEGDEYTVDCMADNKGKIVCAVPRLRLKIFSGVSFEGVTVKSPKLVDLGAKIAERLQFCGPFNFQAKFVNGEPFFFEINPRFSGGGILSVRAGANIPLLSVQEACGCPHSGKVGFEEGVAFSRYFSEVFFKQEGASVTNA